MKRGDQPYPVIASRDDPRSEEYRGNRETNTAAIGKLRAALHEAPSHQTLLPKNFRMRLIHGPIGL